MLLIELQNISYSYPTGNGQALNAVTEISLQIKRGEFLSIIGPNGSGKSTLLKIISGYLKPDSGIVTLMGKKITTFKSSEIAKKIAYVPQTFNSAFPFSVYEIVAMGRNPHLGMMGFERKQDREIIDEVLDWLELSSISHKGINEVSGGEAQRAFIARALAQQTEIILLDEPNAHLDLKHQYGIFELLAKINRGKSLTVVAVTHDLNLAAQFSQRAVLLNNGKSICDEVTAKVLTEQNINSVFEVNARVIEGLKNNKFAIQIDSSGN